MRTMKIALGVFLSLLLIISSLLVAGCDLGGITGLNIIAPAQIDLFEGDITENMTVEVTTNGDWKRADIKAVVVNDSIVRVEYKKNLTNKNTASFKISALKPGSTSIFFETSDGKVRSNILTINVSAMNVSLEFIDSEEVVLCGLDARADLRFTVVKNGDTVEIPDDIDLVSENPDVVTVTYRYVDGHAVCSVTPVSYGETFIYVQSLDGTAQSQKIKVTVDAPIEPSDPTFPESGEQNPEIPDDSGDNQGSADDNQNQDNTDGGDESQAYVLNTSSHKIHHPDCYTIKNMKEENREDVYGPIEEYLEDGYEKCRTCFK